MQTRREGAHEGAGRELQRSPSCRPQPRARSTPRSLLSRRRSLLSVECEAGPPGGAERRPSGRPRGAEAAGEEGGGQAEAHVRRSAGAGRTMSGRRFPLSTTERVIKGAERAGPASATRGKRPRATAGDGEGAAGGRAGQRPPGAGRGGAGERGRPPSGPIRWRLGPSRPEAGKVPPSGSATPRGPGSFFSSFFIFFESNDSFFLVPSYPGKPSVVDRS